MVLPHSKQYITALIEKIHGTGGTGSTTLDTTNFNGILLSSDDTIQEVADRLDDYRGNSRYYVANALVNPAIPGNPTSDEIEAVIGTLWDRIVIYNGVDTELGTEITHVFDVDKDGNATMVVGPVPDPIIDTTNFDNLLSADDDKLQEIFDKIDNYNGNDTLFLGVTAVSPGDVANPTIGEITIASALNRNRFIAYNGTDTDGIPTHVFFIDKSGRVLCLLKPTAGASNPSVFLAEATVNPATAGNPTTAEITTAAGATRDAVLRYNGTDTDGLLTHSYHIDTNGLVTPMQSPHAEANDGIFLTETAISPATAGNPTLIEVAAAAGANRDTILKYNATDVDTPGIYTYVYHIDKSGSVTPLTTPSNPSGYRGSFSTVATFPTDGIDGDTAILNTVDGANPRGIYSSDGTNWTLQLAIDVESPNEWVGGTTYDIIDETVAIAPAGVEPSIAGEKYHIAPKNDGHVAAAVMDATEWALYDVLGKDEQFVLDPNFIHLSTNFDLDAIAAAPNQVLEMSNLNEGAVQPVTFTDRTLHYKRIGEDYVVTANSTGFDLQPGETALVSSNATDVYAHTLNASASGLLGEPFAYGRMTLNGSTGASNDMGTVAAPITAVYETADFSDDITANPAAGEFTIVNAGKYRPKAFHSAENRNDDIFGMLFVDGVEIERILWQIPGTNATGALFDFAKRDFTAGQVVTFRLAGPTTDDVGDQNRDGIVEFFELEQVSTSTIVMPDTLTVGDVEVVLDEQTIGNNGTLTLPTDLSAYEYVRFETDGHPGLTSDVSVEGRVKVSTLPNTLVAMHHDDATGYMYFLLDGTGTTATLTATVNFAAGSAVWRAVGVKAQKTVINTTDIPADNTGVSDGDALIWNATNGQYEPSVIASDNTVIKDWAASTPVVDTEARIIGGLLYTSNSVRTTGAVLDDTELAFWTPHFKPTEFSAKPLGGPFETLIANSINTVDSSGGAFDLIFNNGANIPDASNFVIVVLDSSNPVTILPGGGGTILGNGPVIPAGVPVGTTYMGILVDKAANDWAMERLGGLTLIDSSTFSGATNENVNSASATKTYIDNKHNSVNITSTPTAWDAGTTDSLVVFANSDFAFGAVTPPLASKVIPVKFLNGTGGDTTITLPTGITHDDATTATTIVVPDGGSEWSVRITPSGFDWTWTDLTASNGGYVIGSETTDLVAQGANVGLTVGTTFTNIGGQFNTTLGTAGTYLVTVNGTFRSDRNGLTNAGVMFVRATVNNVAVPGSSQRVTQWDANTDELRLGAYSKALLITTTTDNEVVRVQSRLSSSNTSNNPILLRSNADDESAIQFIKLSE